MAQSTILAAGTTAAVSSNISVAAGTSIIVGIFVDSGNIPNGVQLNLVMDTPGQDVSIAKLTTSTPAVLLTGPGTFRVIRAAITTAVGSFTDTA